jgi:ubiquinone/menaquinone biosynthesis C-methylase UbiE
MLMHVPDADRAFAELARVVRRGGRISIFDFDWPAPARLMGVEDIRQIARRGPGA